LGIVYQSTKTSRSSNTFLGGVINSNGKHDSPFSSLYNMHHLQDSQNTGIFFAGDLRSEQEDFMQNHSGL